MQEGQGSGRWTWYTRVLQDGRSQMPGTWVLVAYLDDRLVGRYEFAADAQ